MQGDVCDRAKPMEDKHNSSLPSVSLGTTGYMWSLPSAAHLLTYLLTYLFTYLLTPWRRVLLVKLTGVQLVKKFPHFREPEGSLPHSQVPATCPYPEPARSGPYPHTLLTEDPSWYYRPIYAWVSKVGSFSQVSPPKPYIRLSSPSYALHAPPNSFFSIITPTVLGEQYRTFSSSLWQLQRLQKYFHIALKLKYLMILYNFEVLHVVFKWFCIYFVHCWAFVTWTAWRWPIVAEKCSSKCRDLCPL